MKNINHPLKFPMKNIVFFNIISTQTCMWVEILTTNYFFFLNLDFIQKTCT